VTTETTDETSASLIYSLPYADAFASGDSWNGSGAWQFDPAAGLNSSGWFANSAQRGQNSTLTLDGQIDLTTVLSPTLTFWQKAILTNGDLLVVEASADGGQTWIPLSEEPGTISEWTQRNVDLSAVSGQLITLRFRLDTTGDLPAGTTSVGLWLDDVAVTLAELLPEPTDEPAPATETPVTEQPPVNEEPTETPTEIVPTEITPTEETSTDEPPAQEPTAPSSILLIVESDDPAVVASGLWTAHNTGDASGGGYIFSEGNQTDTLTLGFTGTQVDVIFVTHPALGSFAVEVDGVPLQIVSSTGDTAFGARTSITGLADGAHTLRIVPTEGTIAIDAFVVAGLAPAEPQAQPPVVDPGLEPTAEPTVVVPPADPTVEPTEGPAAPPQPEVIVPTMTPTAAPQPVLLPYFDSFEVEQTWLAEGSWLYALNGGYTGNGWNASANERGQISTLTLVHPLDLRAAQAPQLAFWQAADLQGDEIFSVEVSVDGGLSWLPIDLQPGWKGVWTQRTVDLTGFRGTVVNLRFVLIAGPSNQNSANRASTISIDDVAVQEVILPTATPLPTVVPTTIPTMAPTTIPTEVPTMEVVITPEVVVPDPATPTPDPTQPPTEPPVEEPTPEPTLPPTEEPARIEEPSEEGAE